MIDGFTEEQKNYLDGFVTGSGLRRGLSLPVAGGAPAAAGTSVTVGPKDIHSAAQDRFTAAGKKLVSEEQAKRAKDGLVLWDEVMAHAKDGKFPKGTDVFMFKFQGLFYVAPAQDSFMCRLRLPAGIVNSHQVRGLADLAVDYAGGYADVTTRANFQLREIGARNTINLLMGLADLGIVARGSGADNIRNVTASPTAGIDAQELVDTRQLAREQHHYILNHKEMYGLPRKFNIAFDGGGTIAALEDTNDIGYTAVRVSEDGIKKAHGACSVGVEPGIYFRLTLGGITGHKDFARDTGLMVKSEDCVIVSHAIVNAFSEHGDRNDRKKARLKYVLDKMGFAGFLKEVEKHLGLLKVAKSPLIKFPLDACDPRPAVDRMAHVGVHPQKQPGKVYVGVVLPVGRMTAAQMKGVAAIADQYGSGHVRLTVWQNLIIPDIAAKDVDAVKSAIEALGLDHSATSVRAGLVACTGSAGCKFAAANTKRHATQIAEHLDASLKLDVPINIHLTGCHHSCAQHYIGDIGLIATKVAVGDDMYEGYHLHVGGGYGVDKAIATELQRDVLATDAPLVVERVLRAYLDHRKAGEEFSAFARRTDVAEFKAMMGQPAAIAA
ncbi:MAG: NirA family protein [Phycisphaerae bacterium]